MKNESTKDILADLACLESCDRECRTRAAWESNSERKEKWRRLAEWNEQKRDEIHKELKARGVKIP